MWLLNEHAIDKWGKGRISLLYLAQRAVAGYKRNDWPVETILGLPDVGCRDEF